MSRKCNNCRAGCTGAGREGNANQCTFYTEQGGSITGNIGIAIGGGMMARLTEKDAYWIGEEFWTSAREPDDEEIDAVYEKLKEYEDLEEQGLLKRLPCKIGDIVYYIAREILLCKISVIEFYKHGVELRIDYAGENKLLEKWGTRISLHDFGKTVFLTREEAEAKLKEVQDE